MICSACPRSASHEVSGSFSTCLTSSPRSLPGLPHPVRSAFRVSHPLDGLLLDDPTGLVSCRSAHGVPPFRAFPSPGAAMPLDIASALLPLTPAPPRSVPEGSYPCSARTVTRRHVASSRNATQPVHDRIQTPLRRGRLQGLCSPGRVRCHRFGCYPSAKLVALLGFMTCCDMASLPRSVCHGTGCASRVATPLLPEMTRRPAPQRRARTPRRVDSREAGGSPVESTADSSVGLPRRRPLS